MKKLFTIICILMVMQFTANAQYTILNPLPQEKLNHKTFGRFLSPDSETGWIKFRDTAPYSAEKIFEQIPELLGMRSEDEMHIWKVNTDVVGGKHFKYSQYYNGIRIEGIEHIVHEKSGRVYLMNGDFVSGLTLNVHPVISPDQAVITALQEFPAQLYMWDVPFRENNFKQKRKNPDATLYPQPELLIVQKELKSEITPENYILAYRMAVFAEIPYITEMVYVDAQTGEMFRHHNLEVNCSPGTAETTFNGAQTVYTNYTSEICEYPFTTPETSYISWDDCNPDTEIKSYLNSGYADLENSDDYMMGDPNNEWLESSNNGEDMMVISTLWAVKQAYSYFLNTWNHESFDGSDGLIDAFNARIYFDDDGNAHCRNANFTPGVDNLNFGAGDDCLPGTTDDYNTLDISGHEFTHGIIRYAHFDPLNYQDESGAINESFADIFGEATERYTEGTGDWLMAGDRVVNGNAGIIRDFINTHSRGDPDTYVLDSSWYSGTGDNGGVHTNSGVQNHIFYMLSEGESGVNEGGIPYNVTGIGFDQAVAIAWHAMMNYLDGNDGYLIARNCWIQSAIDLFGSCSQQVISVGEAFNAAGVSYFTSYHLDDICGTYITLFSPYFVDAEYGIENATISVFDFTTSCTATVNSGVSLTAESGQYIRLNPGFTATSGSTVNLLIDLCEVTEYDANNLRQQPDTEEEFTALSTENHFMLFPNPANQSLTISFNLKEKSAVTLSFLDVAGKMVSQPLSEKYLSEGNYQQEFNAGILLPGIYFCVLTYNHGQLIEKFVVQH